MASAALVEWRPRILTDAIVSVSSAYGEKRPMHNDSEAHRTTSAPATSTQGNACVTSSARSTRKEIDAAPDATATRITSRPKPGQPDPNVYENRGNTCIRRYRS